MGREQELPATVESFTRASGHAVAAFNLRPWDEFWWVAAPPTEWSLTPDASWALMEGDVILAHLVDLAGLEEASCGGVEFRLRANDKEPQVDVTVDGQPMLLGPKPLMDLMHGFETMESVSRRMLAAARELAPYLNAPLDCRE